MHLAKSAEQHIAGLSILFKGYGGILFKQFVKACEHLILIALLLGGYRQGYGRLREIYGSKLHGS